MGMMYLSRKSLVGNQLGLSSGTPMSKSANNVDFDDAFDKKKSRKSVKKSVIAD